MKTKILLLLLSIQFCTYSQVNLVLNGGFENWTSTTTPTNWAVEGNVKQSTLSYYRGFNSVQLSTFLTPLPQITTQVPMKAGITYTIRFKYKYNSPDFERSQAPAIELEISKDGITEGYLDNRIIENTEWRTFQTTFTPDQDLSYDLRISSSSYLNYGFIVDIDEVMVYIEGTEEYTSIPDLYFEWKLIELSVDNQIDGQVLTYLINTLTSLDIHRGLHNSYITDLTGIQDFTALTSLNCTGHKITDLNLIKNTALIKLDCSSNNLATLDLSAQPGITSLACNNNKITSLDLSKHTGLNYISCSNNSLTYLNLKNGNNTAIYWNGTDHGGFSGNPNLTCILVDDVIYSNKNWMDKKNDIASYTISCDEKYTVIPDLNFEKKLIALNIDSGQPDGKVLTASISSLTKLDISASSVKDLKGIEDFISLANLNCSENDINEIDVSKNLALTILKCNESKVSSLNVSNNIKLEELFCMSNQLTNLDLSANFLLRSINCSGNKIADLNLTKNTALTNLNCSFNKLSALDVSIQPALTILECNDNQLTTLDVSKNTALKSFSCINNLLTSLNLKNGKNAFFYWDSSYHINFVGNPNLTCILVDDVDYSNKNWAERKDHTTTYSLNCSSLGLEENIFERAVVYPNPTKGEINIQNAELEKVKVYNSLGQLIKSFDLNSRNTNYTINLAGLAKGVYYLYMINQDVASAKRVILE